MRRAWFGVLAFGAAATALAQPVCTLSTPKDWSVEARAGSILLSREPASRAWDVQGTIELRSLQPTSLSESVAQAKSEAAAWLQGREGAELIRDEALPGGTRTGHLLVYRYRLATGPGWALRYYALVETPHGVAEVTADSRATYITAFRNRKYMQAGAREPQIMAAILSTECHS